MRTPLILSAALLLAACAGHARPGTPAPPTLAEQVRSVLETPEMTGTRWGLLVADEEGREVIAIRPDERFVPASNSKMPTVLANFAMPPQPPMGTAVGLEGEDVVLVGAGDPWLSSKDDCVRDCLSQLADAVAARTRNVRDVIGDDRLWPDERWGQGWSWNNLSTRSGTAISALSLDENVMTITLSPTTPGQRARVTQDGWYTIDLRVTTASETRLEMHRLPGEETLIVTGTVSAKPETLTLAIDDPARFAAWRFAEMLRARGVTITGKPVSRHRTGAVSFPPPKMVARLTPPPLDETLTHTMKVSQNLYAEMLLRRAGDGSGDSGLKATTALFDQAGASRSGWDFSDGSGMSTYNRLSPRASVALLRWAARQPFADRWRKALPIAGVDGTLARRFKGTALEGRLFAKTGSLSGTSVLSGYMTAASGRELTFAIFANDIPSTAPSAVRAMDTALEAIAARN